MTQTNYGIIWNCTKLAAKKSVKISGGGVHFNIKWLRLRLPNPGAFGESEERGKKVGASGESRSK